MLTGEQAACGKKEEEKPKVWLLEYDHRFDVFPEFVFYDFKEPLKLPREFALFSPVLDSWGVRV